ncbi:MAG: glycosyltransferase family 2 protein [Desulfobacterales bacterium]|nr:glycosyltransferase family 2 protein [Desulfobacterales bacterium]
MKAVNSVLDSASSGPVKIVVVDNSMDPDDSEKLRSNLPAGVELFVSPENLGFGRACNLVFEQFPGEYILLLNPDASLVTDCLMRLQKMLASNRKVAAVAPQVFWDDKLMYYLPPSYPPNLFLMQPELGLLGPQAAINRLLNSLWRLHAIRVWRSKTPVKVNNLSGGLCLLKREAVRKVGKLFDPRFFLYFEDTDLFVRLRKAGYSFLIDTKAKAIHHYNQCEQLNVEMKKSYMARSHQIFLDKYCTGWKLRVKKFVSYFKGHENNAKEYLKIQNNTAPFVLDIPKHLQGHWLFEWSPNHDFIPSVGRFGKGPFVDFPEEHCSMLAPGKYFGRIGSDKRFGRISEIVSWTLI